MVKQELLEMIRCPFCMQNKEKENQGKLSLYKESWLICEDCERNFPIINDIPVLLLEEAEKWMETEKKKLPIPPTRE